MNPARRRARATARKQIHIAQMPPPGPDAYTGGQHGTSPRARNFARLGEARFYSDDRQRSPKPGRGSFQRKR